MMLHVAYVLHAEGLGGKVLGVRLNVDQSKYLCQTNYNMSRGEGFEQVLDWITYQDQDAKGWQAQGSVPGDTFYVEESELDLLAEQEQDQRSMCWRDRCLLQKTIENGQLAEQVMQAHDMVQPLGERVEQLSSFVNEILKAAGYKTYKFKTIDGAEELWEVSKL